MMTKKKFFLLTLFLGTYLTIIISPVRATSYFVSPGGNDGNLGTQTAPWKTIQQAANSVSAGDIVNVLAGVYTEPVITLGLSGSARNRIQFVANGTVQVNGAFEIFADYVDLIGFTITQSGCSDRGTIHVDGYYDTIENNHITDSSRIGIYTVSAAESQRTDRPKVDSHHLIVRKNWVNHAGGTSMYIFGNDQLLENNEITHNWIGTCGSSNGDGDMVMLHGYRHTWRGNYFHEFYKSDTTADHVDAFQTFSDPTYGKIALKDSLIENNHIFLGHDVFSNGTLTGHVIEQAWDNNNTITGFMFQGGIGDYVNNVIWRNNIIEAWKGGDFGGNTNCCVTNVKFYNNALIGSQADGNTNGAWSAGLTFTNVTGIEAFNNVLLTYWNGINFDDLGYVSSGVTGKNLMFNVINCSGYNAFTYKCSLDLPSADPKFVSLTLGDYHLQPISPAVDAGKTPGTFTNPITGLVENYDPFDFESVTRPVGSAWDVGPYEYGGMSLIGDLNNDGNVNVLDLRLGISRLGNLFGLGDISLVVANFGR